MNNLKDFIKNTLVKEFNIKELNEIQNETIPEIARSKNTILVSRTGTGKTFCYLIPILESINYNIQTLQSIIVVPTKELVRQISKNLNAFKKHNNNIKFLCISDRSKEIDLTELSKKQGYQIIVCMPQKFEEITKYKILVKNINSIVLDEADMTLDLGFFNFINQGFNSIKNIDRIQKIAVSATLHKTLSIQINKFFKNSIIINKSPNIWENQNINHFVIHYNEKNKQKTLLDLIKKLNPYFGIIFCNTKKEVDELYDFLYQNNKSILKLHGGLENRKRKNIYKDIKNLKVNLLIATDLASRGIDIEGASHIISYDLPKEDIWYVHRAGRSGRKNYIGNSYVFFDQNSIYQIVRLQRKGIVWNNLKYHKNDFVDFDYTYKEKPKKETEIDRQIRDIINKSSKKVKPNYKKKIKLEIKEIKRKAKRQRIEELMNKERIKKYKIENAQKSKEKQRQRELEEKRTKQREKRKNRRR